MTFYPKIAEFSYKDKNIDMTIPIHIKLLKVKDYCCEKCKYKVSLKTLAHTAYMGAIKLSPHMMSQIKEAEFQKTSYPKVFMKDGNPLCPTCKSLVTTEIKVLYKLYITYNAKFINMLSLMNSHTIMNWKREKSKYSNTIYTFCNVKKAEEISKKFEELTDKKAKFKTFTISEEILEQNYKDYQTRRVLRAI